MDERRRSSAVAGLILILLGGLFLVGQLFPSLWNWVGGFSWPLIVVAVGVLLLVLGVVLRAPGMIVPACIVGGIGCLLYWQNATNNWESWSYAWALIPGFVGVGTVLLGLINRDGRTTSGGLWLILISLVLFAVFGSFLGNFQFLGSYWPVLLIALGVLSLVRALFRSERAPATAGTIEADRADRPDRPASSGSDADRPTG